MTIGFLLQSTKVLEGGLYDEEDLRMIYGYMIHIDDEILNDYYNTCTIFTYDNDLELYIEIIDALIKIFEEYIVNVINILITPSSYWHNHDKDIIWFDIKELNLMEKWVSDKIGKEFKLKQVNSSQHIECSLKLNQNFKERYNSVYDFYDTPKTNKTLI